MPNKRSHRIVPIIPAIPRSLEKRKFKEVVKSDTDGGGTGSTIPPISPQKQESHEETATSRTRALQNASRSDLNTKDDVQEDGVQEDNVYEAVVENLDSADPEKEVATAGKSTFQSILPQNNQCQLPPQ